MLKLLISIVCGIGIATTALSQTKQDNYYTKNKSKLHSYLLIGQSNMAGRAPLLPKDKLPVKNAYLFNDKDQWEPLGPQPINIYSTIRKNASMQRLSMGLTFAQSMLEGTKGISIGIISNAKGGSSILEWAPGTRFFKEAVKRAKAASKTSTLKGILWHQGEANWNNNKYNELLTEFITALRKELNAPGLPVVAGQINNNPKFNKNILKVTKILPNSAVASTEGLKAMDRWHFDNKSMKILGRRYAEAMKKLQKKSAE